MTTRCKADLQSLLADYQQALQLSSSQPGSETPLLQHYHEFFLRHQHVLQQNPQLFLQQAANWHQPSVQLPARQQLSNSSPANSPTLQLLFPHHADATPDLRWQYRPDGPHAPVSAIACTPALSGCIVAAIKRTIHIVDANSGQLKQLLQTALHRGEQIEDICLSPDGLQLAAATTEGTVHLWKLIGTQFCSVELPAADSDIHTAQDADDDRSALLCIDWSPNLPQLFTGSNRGSLRRRATKGSEKSELLYRWNNLEILRIAVSPAGDRIAVGLSDQTVRLLHIDSLEILMTLSLSDRPASLAWSPTGTLLLVATIHGRISAWSTENGAQLQQWWHDDKGRGVRCLCWCSCPQGSQPRERIISAGYDDQIRFWSVPEGTLLKAQSAVSQTITCLTAAPDAAQYFSGGDTGRICAWKQPTHFSPAPQTSQKSPIHTLEFSPDGRFLASGSLRSGITFRDAENGSSLSQIQQPNTAICWSPQGDRIAAACTDGHLRIWLVIDGREIAASREKFDHITSLSWHPTKPLLLFAGQDGLLRIWSHETQQIQQLSTPRHTRRIDSARWSGSGTLFLSAGWDGRLIICSIHDNSTRTLQQRGTPILTAKWTIAPDTIIGGNQQHEVCLWSLATGNCQILLGHTGPVTAVASSANGRFVVSAAQDCTICLWEFRSGQLLAQFPAEEAIYSVATSDMPDGSLRITAALESGRLLWLQMPAFNP